MDTPQDDTVGIVGKITNVKNNNQSKLFTVLSLKSNISSQCCIKTFCPLEENDSISLSARLMPQTGLYEVVGSPFVIPPTDRDSIVTKIAYILMRGSRGEGKENFSIANQLYSGMERKNKVCHEELSELAGMWHQSHSPDIIQFMKDFLPSLSQVKIEKILSGWYDKHLLRRLYLFGLTKREIRETYTRTDLLYDIVIDTPERCFNLSIEKVDSILARQGTDLGSNRSIVCLSRYLYNYVQKGYTSIPIYYLQNISYSNLGNIGLSRITDVEIRGLQELGIVFDMDSIYFPRQYEMENILTKWLIDTLKEDGPAPKDSYKYVAKNSLVVLNKEQIEAVEMALTNPISIVQGEAGTGKTTVICEIASEVMSLGLKCRLSSFTGKAVSRVKDVVRPKIPTLAKNAATLDMIISRGDEETELLIIDESSMVTSEIMYRLVTKCSSLRYIVLVGDMHQLPPISSGSFMHQVCLLQGLVPSVTLKENHRSKCQDGKINGIVLNCRKIAGKIDGVIVEGSQELENAIVQNVENGVNISRETGLVTCTNFFIYNQSREYIPKIVSLMKEKGVSHDKVKVITSKNEDVQAINTALQYIYNNDQPGIMSSDKKLWRLGDRVMSLVNDYNINVMNGEEGIICKIDQGKPSIFVRWADNSETEFLTNYNIDQKAVFDDAEGDVDADSGELTVKNISLSFCLTVHKSQGSEWPYVIYNPSSFIDLRLMYVALSRGISSTWVIGNSEFIQRGMTYKQSYSTDNLALRVSRVLLS